MAQPREQSGLHADQRKHETRFDQDEGAATRVQLVASAWRKMLQSTLNGCPLTIDLWAEQPDFMRAVARPKQRCRRHSRTISGGSNQSCTPPAAYH